MFKHEIKTILFFQLNKSFPTKLRNNNTKFINTIGFPFCKKEKHSPKNVFKGRILEDENRQRVNLFLKQQEEKKRKIKLQQENEAKMIEKKLTENSEKFVEQEKNVFIETNLSPKGIKMSIILNSLIFAFQGYSVLNIVPLHQIFWTGSLIGLSKLYYQFRVEYEEDYLKLFIKAASAIMVITFLLTLLTRFSNYKTFSVLGLVFNYILMIFLLRSYKFSFFIPYFIKDFYTYNFIFAFGFSLFISLNRLSLNQPILDIKNEQIFCNSEVKLIQQQYSNDLISIILELEKDSPNFDVMKANMNKINKIPIKDRIKEMYDSYLFGNENS